MIGPREYSVLLAVVVLGQSQFAFAGGAVMQRQRMQQMKAQQQAMIQQQMALQIQAKIKAEAQQKAQAAAQQQAVAVAKQQAQVVAQYQAQKLANEAAVVAQYQAQKAAVQTATEAAMAAQYSAQQAAVQAVALQRQAQQETMQQVLEAGLKQKLAEEAGTDVNAEQEEPEVQEIATLDDVVRSLDDSSEAWPLMIDAEAKEAVVRQYIYRYRQQGAAIHKPAAYYVQMIDAMSQQSPEMLERPFPQVLQTLAIIEYDFDNGSNKDAMALKVLGNQQAVEQNKKRLGIE